MSNLPLPERLSHALQPAPVPLRGLFYFLIILAAIALAPLVGLVAAVRWLGHKNRLPTSDEAGFALCLALLGSLLWAGCVTAVLVNVEIVKSAVAEVCRVQER